MDMLFAADSPWVWDAERNFKLLKQQNPDLVTSGRRVDGDVEAPMKESQVPTHVEHLHDLKR